MPWIGEAKNFFKPQNFCCKCIVAIIFFKVSHQNAIHKIKVQKRAMKVNGKKKEKYLKGEKQETCNTEKCLT